MFDVFDMLKCTAWETLTDVLILTASVYVCLA